MTTEQDKVKMYVVIVKQDKPSDWEDSWKLSGAETKDTTDDETLTTSSFNTETTLMLRINDVFLTEWSDSWLLSAAPLKEEEEEERHKNWSSCWGYRQRIRWVGVEK